MKPKFVARLHLIALALAVPAQAGTYYWDLNGTVANAAIAATGAWDGTNAFWNDAATGTGGTPTSSVGNSDDLVFSSGSLYTTGTITASGSRAASSISFEDNVPLILAGAVTIGGGGTKSGIFVQSGDNSNNSVTGALTLNGANTFQNAGTAALAINTGGINGAGNLELKNNSSGTLTLSTSGAGIVNNTGTITNSGSGSGGVSIGQNSGTAGYLGSSLTGIIQNSATSALTIFGSNQLTSFAGPITVKSGTANIVNSNASGGATKSIYLGDISGNASASIFMGSGATNASTITVEAGSSGVKTIGSVYAAGGAGTTMTWSGNITANDNVTVSANGSPSVGLVLSGSSISIAANKTMTLVNASNAASKLKISGNISGDATTSIVLNSAATLSGSNASFLGSTTINNTTLALDYTNVASKLGDNGALTLGGATLTLANGASAHTEVVASTTLNPGLTTISRTSGTSVLSMNSITRNTGGAINFGAASIAETDTPNTNGILGGWATIAGTDWAVNSTDGDNGPITALSSYTLTSVALDLAGNYTDNNISVDSSQTPAGAITPNSLRFNDANAHTLSLTGANTITSGGILVTSAVATNLSSITGGTLQGAASSDLVVNQSNTGAGLTIASSIADNSGPTGLTKTGAGLLTLSGANSHSGITKVVAGTLDLGNLDALQNSTLDTMTAGTQLVAFGVAGTYNIGAIQGADPLEIGANTISVGSNNSTTPYTGVISGIDGSLTKVGSGALTLGGANTFSGVTTISTGKIIASSAGALGAGTVANSAILDLTAGAVTYTGLSTSLSGAGTVNVTVGTGTGATILNGDYSAFTGIWNIGTSAAAGAGKVQMTGSDNASATINVLANATVFASNTHNAAIVLNGGDTGENLGQLRLTAGTDWAGPVTLAGAITSTDDGHVGITTGSGTISGAIGETSGPRDLVKVGAGTIVLSGPNNYKGGTVVNVGTLTLLGNQTAADGGYAVNLANSGTATLNLGSSTQTATTSIAVASGKTVQAGGSGGTSFEVIAARGAPGFVTTVVNNGSLVASRNSSIVVDADAAWTQNGAVNVQAVGGYGASLTIQNSGTFTYTGATPIQLTQVLGTSSESKLTVASAATLSTGQPIDYNGSSGTPTGLSRLTLTGAGKIVLSANIAQLTTGDAGGLLNLGTGGGLIDTAGFSTTLATGIANVAAQTGSLTKEGLGTLTLSGTSTYTGDTTVSAGTLELAATTGSLKFIPTATGVSNKITGAGTLNLKGIFNIDLTGAVATLGNTWTLVDVGTLVETFDASFSVAGFTESANVWTKLDGVTGNMWKFEESNGVLSYVVAPASGFSSWITGTFANGSVPGGQQGTHDDPDGDGVSNLEEYAVAGLDPTVPNGSVGTFTGMTLTISKRQPLAADITYAIEESTDLGLGDPWQEVPAGPNYVNNSTTISYLLPGGPAKDFLHLKVEKP